MKKLLPISCATLLLLISVRVFSASELLMFNADYCTWCHKWEEEIGGIYHLTAESCDAPLHRFDFTYGGMPDAVTIEQPVTYTPTFVLLQDRQEVGRITGYPGADFFWVELNQLIKDGLSAETRQANSSNCSNS